MRFSFITTALLFTILVLAIACDSQPSATPIGTSSIQMTATVNGLGKGEEAVLKLSPETATTAEEVLFEKTIISDGEGSITADIRTSLKDGYYQLLLEAPDKYFRDPKGYFFQVYQSKIVNPTNMSIVFNLIPPPFEPYLEGMVSLSAPMKQGVPITPLVSGTILGLLNSYDLVTVHAYTVTGWEKMYFTREGNGPWEAIIPNPDESEYYTITAEAEGYTTQPPSYKIKIEGETAYVVSNNKIGEEALHIDFQFSPNNP
jgi:hypothetical protein